MSRKVADTLWVGDAEDARAEVDGYDYVITVAGGWRGDYTDFYYPMDDGPHDYERFRNAATLTKWLALDQRNRVLVHCQAGISRSVSVVTAAIAAKEEKPFEDVLVRTRTGYMSPDNELVKSGRRYAKESLKYPDSVE